MSLEQTQRRRKAVGTIHDIVSAMRAIAAGRIQNAQRALSSARRFQQIVQKAIVGVTENSGALSLPNVTGRPTLLMVMTSEQPLCGAFNQNVLDLAEKRWREMAAQGPVHLVLVGRRGVRQTAARRMVADHAEPAATSLVGLRDLAKRLATLVDQRFAAGKLGPLHVIYSRHQSISAQVPTEEQILPLDLPSMRRAVPPPESPFYRYVETPVLLAGLVSQYAFISLYRMAADSHASEQASRLLAMDGATRSTEKMLKTLNDLERRERQGEITRQVLELIAARLPADGPNDGLH
jgi:F-type H+-transporting ATPase subunit gamma